MRLSLPFIAGLLLAGPAAAADPPPLIIDSESSGLQILVYRAGIVSGLGHNHVIEARTLSGELVAGENGRYRATVQFSLQSLVVDDPQARSSAGDDFKSDVSERDRQGTRRNMLGPRLLNASADSVLTIRTLHIEGDAPDLQVTAEVTGGSVSGIIRFPATVVIANSDEDPGLRELTISGEANISHAELGLKPFSAALGMLKVRNDMTVHFHIVARSGD